MKISLIINVFLGIKEAKSTWGKGSKRNEKNTIKLG